MCFDGRCSNTATLKLAISLVSAVLSLELQSKVNTSFCFRFPAPLHTKQGHGYQEVLFQVWFQNRRAKFRRNERSVLAQRSGLYGRETSHQLGGNTAAAEQPLAPRPTAVLPSGTVQHHQVWSDAKYTT